MPTLVLPPRYTPDSIAMSGAAARAGWGVERLASWRAPEWLKEQDLVFYGEPLFAAAVAEPLGIALVEPRFDWLPGLPERYRRRRVRLTTLAEARREMSRAFIKPADDKCFRAAVYESGAALNVPEIVPAETPVLISDPVEWDIEFRLFVLERRIATMSPYVYRGALAQNEEGEWVSPEGTEAQARALAERLLADDSVPMPPAFVLDVGRWMDGTWAVVEANSAWGAGICGCEPAAVLEVVRRACVAAGEVSEEDREWVVVRG